MAVTCGFDASGNPRTANPGYDCRVNSALGLWNFCPTTVISASDCGMAGYCVDQSSCTSGCGPLSGDATITTYTCSGNSYCSTVVSDNLSGGSFVYIACGAAEGTGTLYATPISTTASTTSSSSTSTSSLSSTTATAANTPSPFPSATASSTFTAGPAKSDDVGAIVGGIVGGLAIICLTVLAGILIRRRSASAARRSKAAPPAHDEPSDEIPPPDQPMTHYELAGSSYYAPAKDGGRESLLGPYEMSEANRDPIELPGVDNSRI